jgi:hypothetical protein
MDSDAVIYPSGEDMEGVETRQLEGPEDEPGTDEEIDWETMGGDDRRSYDKKKENISKVAYRKNRAVRKAADKKENEGMGGNKRQTIRRRPLEGASKTNCGDCATCRNPKAKQACRKREVLQDGAGPVVCLVEETQLPSSPNQESLAAAEFRESRLE